MTSAHRAFLGALVGAVIALFGHPLSRPWLNYGFRSFGPSPKVSSSPHLARTVKKVPTPDSDENLSLFVQAAMEQMVAGTHLDGNDALLLAELCRTAAEKDPQNAYWRQSEAVFQFALGNKEAAETAWDRASKRAKWNDYQTPGVEAFLSDLRADSGAAMAWHAAVGSEMRCTAPQRVVASLGKGLLNQDPGLENRLRTFSNAVLLRDNSRSRIGAWHGFRLAETAAKGPFPIAGTQRVKTAIRAEFPTELIQAGLDAEGRKVAQQLSENEAFDAFVFTADADKEMQRMVGQSVLLSTAPGALLLASTVSGVLFLITFAIPLHRLGDPVHPSVPAGLALVLALGAYLASRDLLISLWILLTVALFAIHPPVTLTSPTLRMPRIAALVGTMCAALFAALVASFGVVESTPFYSLKQMLPTGWWAEGSTPVAYGILMVTGMFVILSQVVSYRLKRPAGRFCIAVARQGLAQSALACLFGAVVMTPTCIYLDDRLSKELRKVALNETAYYLNR